MNGRSGTRGYLLQAISCLLEALDNDNNWESFTIEPDQESEKVDIIWNYSEPKEKKAVQIKSSQNQISKSQVKLWAKELEDSEVADSYQLILIGPASQSVIKLKNIGKVEIPIPKVLDVMGLIEQAAHRLDKYLENRGTSKLPPTIRELLINAFVSKLEAYSTAGIPITRAEFSDLLNNWLLVLYPETFKEMTEMDCDLLCDTVVIPRLTAPSHDSYPILLPLSLVNNGSRAAIIEWIAIKIESQSPVKLYTPVAIIDYKRFIQGKRALHAENTISSFSEFAVPKNSMIESCILFSQEENNPIYPFNPWTEGIHIFKIYMKYRDRTLPSFIKEISFDITNKLREQYERGESLALSYRKIKL